MTAAELAEKLLALANENHIGSDEEVLLGQAAARLRSMEEALRPFAEIGATNWTLRECPEHMTCDIDAADIHRARAALSGEKQ